MAQLMWLRRSLRLFLLLALLLAPVGMAERHAAMAATPGQSNVATSHCAEMDGAQVIAGNHQMSGPEQVTDAQEDRKDGSPMSNIDCMMACSCMPTLGAQLEAPETPKSGIAAVNIPLVMRGLHPHADPRPPQFA